MKNLLTAFAALGLTVALPHAAHAMECCKDGKCACCTKEDEAQKPAPEDPHKH